MSLVKNNQQNLVNYQLAFFKPSVGSLNPSAQRWLRETQETQAEVGSLPEVSHLGEENPSPKAKASAVFPRGERPCLLRSGTGDPSAKVRGQGGLGDVRAPGEGALAGTQLLSREIRLHRWKRGLQPVGSGKGKR